jgi:hypothetical protein
MQSTVLARPYRTGGTKDPIHYPTLSNKPGVLMGVPKTELQVDKTYQRRVNVRAVHRIALNWNYIACGALICSMRGPNASIYYIVDGQHRWEAAKQREDVKEIPCLVFEILDIKDEAAGFLAANTERQIPAMIHRFNALVTVNDTVAVLANELIKDSGRIVRAQTGKQFISCIGELMRCIRADNDSLLKVWPIVLELAEGSPLSGRLLKGMWALERNLDSYSLASPRVKAKLLSIGVDGLLASMRAVAAIEGNSTERTCAQGILRAINVGARGVQLKMKHQR